MSEEIAVVGIGVETAGVEQGIKILEVLASTGAKVETAMAGVEKSAAKTGKSLATLGQSNAGLSKLGDDAGKIGKNLADTSDKLQNTSAQLDKTGASASNAAAGIKKFTDSAAGAATATAGIGKSATTAGTDFDKAVAGILGQVERIKTETATAGKSLSDSLRIKAQIQGLDEKALAPYISQLKAAEEAQDLANKSLGSMGMSAKATAAALRVVPAQFTDIITSLQGGQAPLTVLLQQGGQLKDMFGGVGGAARALGGYVLGLINPFTIAAAAVGAIGYASYKSNEDLKELRTALLVSGNAAGISADQLLGMSRSVGLNVEVLSAFARSGAVTAENIEGITRAAVKFESIGGAAVADTVKAFEQLKRSPVEASVSLNETTNYLTASLYAQIKALDEQGRHLDAVALAGNSYRDALSKIGADADKNLGALATWWKRVKEGADAAANSAKNAFGPTPIDTQASSAAQKVLAAQSAYDFASRQQNKFGAGGADTAYLASLKKVVDDATAAYNKLTGAREKDAKAANDTAKQNDLEAAKRAFQDQIDSTRSNAEKRLLERTSIINRGAAAQQPQADINRQLSLIDQQYDTGASVAAVQRAEDAKLQAIARAQDQINALRATGQLTEIGQITATTDQTLKAIDVRKNALLAERAIVAGRQNSEREVVALDTQIAALSQERTTAQLKGLNAVTVAWYQQKQAIQATYEAMKAEDAAALVAEQQRLDQIAKGVAEGFRDQAVALQAVNRQIDLQVDSIGQTDQARAIGIEKLRIQLDLEKKIAELNRTDFKSQQDRNDAIAKATEQAAEQSAQASTRITVEYWASAVSEIKSNLTDGIISGFKDGGIQGAIRGVRDSFEKAFEKLVLRPIIEPIMGNIAQTVAGAFGVSPTGSPANGLTAAQAAANSGSGISSIFGGAGSLFGAGFKAGLGSVFGESGIAGGLSAGTTAIGAGNVAGGLGTLAGVAAPFVAGVAAISALAKAMQYTVTPTGNALTATLSGSGIPSGQVGTRADFQQVGGLFGGGTTNNSTWGVADARTTAYISASVQAGTAAIKAYAGAIGLSAKDVDSFTESITVSLTGLNAAGAQKAIDTAIADFVSDMVTSAYGGALDGVAKAGETSSATIARLATNLTQVNAGLSMLGESMLPVGIEGAKAAAGLVDAFGGLDKMQSAVSKYYDLMYSDSEKAASAAKNLDTQFAALGMSVPASNAEFRKLVDGIDITTTAGQSLAASVISLAPAFDQVAQSAARAAQAAQAATTSAVRNWGSPTDVRNNDALNLQRTLHDSGLDVDIQTILGATKESVLALYNTADQATKDALKQNQQAIYDFVNKSDASAGSVGVGVGSGLYIPSNPASTNSAPAVDPAIAERVSLQQQLDALTLNGIDLAKKQLEAQRALIQESNKALFDQVKAAELAKTNSAIQDQIDVLKGTKTARQLQVEQALAAAGDASTLALLKVKFALEDTAAVVKENASLQDQIDVLNGTSTAREMALKQALAGTTDESTRALIRLKFSLEDAAAVTAKFQSALGSLASNNTSLQVQLLTLNGDDAGAAALKRSSDIKLATTGFTDAQIAEYTKQYDANVALANQIKAVQAAQAAAASAAQAATQAAQALKSAWQGVTDGIFGEVKRIRGLNGTSAQSYASAQADFAIASARAGAGDQKAAQALPQLSQTLLALAEAQATSLIELQVIRGQTAGALEKLGNQFAGQYGLSVPSFDVGTNLVPQDMLAMVHKGEAIIPAAYNPANGWGGGSSDALLAAFQALQKEVAALRVAQATGNENTLITASVLRRVTRDGDNMVTKDYTLE
jgi:phage-related minor tail protein